MTFLLDINVLIARVDPAHSHHALATRWLAAQGNASIATCPFTENGFLRIYGNPVYPGGPGSPEATAPILRAIRSLPQHVFFPDDLSLADTDRVTSLAGVGHQQVTDLYLLALAVKHSALFATFDRRIDPVRVAGGSDALRVIR